MSFAALAIGQGLLSGVNALRNSANRKREYRRQRDRYNNFIGDVEGMGLNEAYDPISADYGRAMRLAQNMNQGMNRNALSQVNRQVGAMNTRSRQMGLPMDSQGIGHMIGGITSQLGAQNSRTMQGLVDQDLNMQMSNRSLEQQSRKDQLQYLQAKHFGRPTAPAGGQGFFDFLQGGIDSVGGYMSNMANDSMMQGLAKNMDFDYKSPDLFGLDNWIFKRKK